jgi:peptidoglycan/xylan/chitin deacetylase (PgdA/CDA1 family)
MRLHWLLPTVKGIPVLMYHRVWPGLQDGITVTPEQLREHWTYLKNEGFDAISLAEFLQIAKGAKPPRANQMLLTFDDGYQNNLTYVYPLLKEFDWKATFFIIADSLEGNIDANDPLTRKMTANELIGLDPDVVQLGMHGYHHEHFSETPMPTIKAAITKSIGLFKEHNIPLHHALAYPYGGRPGDKKNFDELKEWMRDHKIDAAFRIGNQVSKIPAPDIYEIRRIDVKGSDGVNELKIKLRKGKLKPF